LLNTLSDAGKGCDPACDRQVTRWCGPSIYKAKLFGEVIVSMMTTSTNVLGKRGALNAVVDGYRYTKNRSYKENVYYRCVEQSTCSARITLTDGVLSSPLLYQSTPTPRKKLPLLSSK
jgi:hypothetical protein